MIVIINHSPHHRSNYCKSASLLFAMLVAAWIQIASAQPPTKIPRIGYVSGTGNATNQGPYVEAQRHGPREFGHVEGKHD